jgi:large conductance mechanosensitive channel
MGVVDDLKAFITQPTFINMATGIVVGVAIGSVVSGLVQDIVNPAIGVLFHADFTNVGRVTINGSSFLFGAFLSALINFVVVMTVIFFVLVYPIAKYTERKAARAKKGPPTTKSCPECFSTIDVRATRCSACGASIKT